jgi:hypothetical protein
MKNQEKADNMLHNLHKMEDYPLFDPEYDEISVIRKASAT